MREFRATKCFPSIHKCRTIPAPVASPLGSGQSPVPLSAAARWSCAAAAPAAAAAPMYRKLAPIVKSIVARQEETKCMGLTVENGVTHNAQMTNADIQPLLAGQSQGTSSCSVG